jgi:hypothetical protein
VVPAGGHENDSDPLRHAPRHAITCCVLRRALAIAIHVGLFVGLGTCQYVVAGWWAASRGAEVPPTCLGSERASRQVVYLHGLDTMAPSWQELDHRRALATLPDTAIALPRAPACGAGRCWPDGDDGAAVTIAAIREAARACFGERGSYGVVGFSRGGFALARLASCQAADARWAIVASAFGHAGEPGLRDCPVAVVVGRRDRHHHDGAIGYARSREGAGWPTRLIEHAGGHRLDAASLSSAIEVIEEIEPEASR